MRLEAFIRALCFATFLAFAGAVLWRASDQNWMEGFDAPSAVGTPPVVGVILVEPPLAGAEGELGVELAAELERTMAGRLQEAARLPIGVEVVIASEPGAAARATRHLLRDAGAIAIVTDGASSMRGAIAAAARDSGVPVLATRPAPAASHGDRIIDLAGSREQRVLPALAWGIGLFGPRVAVVTDGRTRARETRDVARSSAAASGGEIVAEIVLPKRASEHAAALAALARSRPSFILVDFDETSLAESIGLLHRVGLESASAPCVHVSDDASRWSRTDVARRLVGDYLVLCDWLGATGAEPCPTEIGGDGDARSCDMHRLEGAVSLVARAFARGGGDASRLGRAIRGEQIATSHGFLAIEPRTGDAWCSVRAVRVGADGRFDEVLSLPRLSPNALTHTSARHATVEGNVDE